MSLLETVGLVAAGFGGGLVGSIAGLASVATYPALLASGLTPIAANVTNTVALVFSSVGSVTASRIELAGQWRRFRQLLPLTLVGGITGAAAVLLTPSAAFARIVPWLIGLAALSIVVPRRTSPATPEVNRRPVDRGALRGAVVAVSFYGGYFGAAAGVVLLAILLSTTSETLARANAAKNVLLGTANFSGAVVFAFFGPVRWAAVVSLGLGCLLGGRAGPSVVRRVPGRELRLAIGGFGLVLAVVLAYRSYA